MSGAGSNVYNSQLILLALAVLSLDSPGFDDARNLIASRLNNTEAGRAKLYDDFRRIRNNRPKPA